MKDEKIIWESYQGKTYRMFHLIKTSLLFLSILVLFIYIKSLLEINFMWKPFLALLIIGAIYIFVEQFKLKLVKYVITNERVIIKRGWLNIKLTSINLVNILDTKAEQTFKERLIRTGTIYLFTANDSQNSEDNFIQNVPRIANVDNPFERHSEIAEIIKESKRNQYSILK